MPEDGIRSTYSQCPFQILMYDEHGMAATGTAFFYELNDDWFLITNWHNFSGRSFTTNEHLTESRREPTHIKAKFATYVSPSGQFTTVAKRIDIYREFEPLWLEHPELSSRCDVVALPIDRPHDCPPSMHNAANAISTDRIPVEPGGTVFIIGFPSSISVYIGLPLWKSGYIASEPYYDVIIGGSISEVGGLLGGFKAPAFFIDSQTREGMSGSPVFASYTGNWDSQDPYGGIPFDSPDFWKRSDVFLGSTGREFVGCYSGRIGDGEERAALGLCWRREIIDHICASRKTGKHPHFA